MLEENERELRSALLEEPPAALDIATLGAIRREIRKPGIFFRHLSLAASIAVLLGVVVFGIGEYRRDSERLDDEGAVILEMTCMAAVSDFYGEFTE
jgi:hypothetical protein